MQYLTFTNPDTGLKVRQGARDGSFVKDQALDSTGFDGDENTNWINIEMITP
jgi:hypothetical protein